MGRAERTVTGPRHQRHRGGYREARRQRIPKVGHRDFRARPLARFQYLVRMRYLRDKTNIYIYTLRQIYRFTFTFLSLSLSLSFSLSLTCNLIINLIHSCVCLTSHFWHHNRSEEGIVSEAERPDTDTCKIAYTVPQIYFSFLLLIREMDDDLERTIKFE